MIKIIIDAYKSQMEQKAISKLYKTLEDLKADDTFYVKVKWEGEANVDISKENWEELNEHQWKTTNSWMWREYGWRICGTMKADHFHIFWGCSLINQYWKEVKKVIDEVIKIKFPSQFEILYLGNFETLNL